MTGDTFPIGAKMWVGLYDGQWGWECPIDGDGEFWSTWTSGDAHDYAREHLDHAHTSVLT